MSHAKVTFSPRWKEELVCSMDGKTFIMEFTMGIAAAYMPTKEKWEACAPDWAKNQWERVRADLEDSCKQQQVPFEIEERAWVQFE